MILQEKVISIEPVSRIAGSASVTIRLDEDGTASDAFFHVNPLRGFERFCIGRPIEEMPLITSRICGLCSVSHHLASAKAVEDAFGIVPPETAVKLRELMHLAEIIRNHFFHFIFMAAPDLLLDPETDPKKRNFQELSRLNPDVFKKTIFARIIADKIIKIIGGPTIHPVIAIPGGLSRKGLNKKERSAMLRDSKDLSRIAIELWEFAAPIAENNIDTFKTLQYEKTKHMSIIDKGEYSLSIGKIKVLDENGNAVHEFSPSSYLEYISERVEPWTRARFPYLRKVGWPDGVYRVGPLSRLNVADSIQTPKAQEALIRFRRELGRPVHSIMLMHYARLIEIVCLTEKILDLLEHVDVTGSDIKSDIEFNGTATEGIGAVEAPRGTLIHHYKADEKGLLHDVNIIAPTQSNNAAINTDIRKISRKLIHNGEVSKELLNEIEMVVRSYDPCIPCATHTLNNKRFISIQVLDTKGNLVMML